MVCKKCNVKLKISVEKSINGKKYKSCPRCSVLNGEYHVFQEFPEAFGITTKRVTETNKEGIQSYCVIHRTNKNASIPSTTLVCSEFK